MSRWDDAAVAAGLVPVAPGVYCTEPTRSHVVLVMRDAYGRWVTWAGRYARWREGGREPVREWDLYTGPRLDAALGEAMGFARRLTR